MKNFILILTLGCSLSSYGQEEIWLLMSADTVKVQISFIHNGYSRESEEPFRGNARNLLKAIRIDKEYQLLYFAQEYLDDSLRLISKFTISEDRWLEFQRAISVVKGYSDQPDPAGWDGPIPLDYIIISNGDDKIRFSSYRLDGRKAFNILLDNRDE